MRVLGFIWSLPGFVIFWAFYVVPLWATKRIVYAGSPAFLVWRFDVNEGLAERSWWVRKWKGWSGFAGHSCIMIKPSGFHDGLLQHELRHTVQAFILGPFYFPIYGLIWLFTRYKKHPMEMDAEEHEHE